MTITSSFRTLRLVSFLFLICHIGFSNGGAKIRRCRQQNIIPADGAATYKIAALLPDLTQKQAFQWPFSRQLVEPAIRLALDWIERQNFNFNVSVSYADSHCDDARSLNAAIEFYVEGDVDVFFGPCCDYAAAPIARQVRYWNIPLITSGAIANDYYEKKLTKYPLVTRVGVTVNSLATFVSRLLKRYGWQYAKMIYEPYGQREQMDKCCHMIADGLFNSQDLGGKILGFYRLNTTENKNLTETLTIEINTKKRHYAIIILCVDQNTLRSIMLEAAKLNFNNGEYVFINIDLFSSQEYLARPWYRSNDTNQKNEEARLAFRVVKTITLHQPKSEQFEQFTKLVKNNSQPSYNSEHEKVNCFVSAFHDAVILYSLAVNETLAAGEDPTNGTIITSRMWNRTFNGITGQVSMDEFGDRSSDYSLLQMEPKNENGAFKVAIGYHGHTREFMNGSAIYWPKRETPPPDTPTCGYDLALCLDPFPVYAVAIGVLGSLLAIVSLAAIATFYCYKKLKGKRSRDRWRVNWENIEPLGRNAARELDTDPPEYFEQDLRPAGDGQQFFTTVATYTLTMGICALKSINCGAVRPSKELTQEIIKIKELQNEHVAKLFGLCIDHSHQYLVTEYCSKGSLMDVLQSEQIKLDSMFKFSLIQDLERGMSYLHNRFVHGHENLKSTNCLIDSRFVLKLTDFGLRTLRTDWTLEEILTPESCKAMLWTAPEHLRSDHNIGSQKGDVYSFAIICQEIIYQRGPFWTGESQKSPEDICLAVRKGRVRNSRRDFLRPVLSENIFVGDDYFKMEMFDLINRCWREDPTDRPDFYYIKSKLHEISGGGGGDLLTNLLSRMEKYADNLETIVKQRTDLYLKEKEKAEQVLFTMLPRSIAQKRINDEEIPPERFDSVTIYFSDIVGFTKIASESQPEEIVQLLDDLYREFDKRIGDFDVYKVETIGDAYMVASGLPNRHDLHAREIARMALSLLHSVKSFTIAHRPNERLQLRIGIHSGCVYGCIVGQKMPRYCLVGDTVNTASRMESNGLPLQIHVSAVTKRLLDKHDTFIWKYNGLIFPKGKQAMETWWLVGDSAISSYVDNYTETTDTVAPYPPPACRRGSAPAMIQQFDVRRKSAVSFQQRYNRMPHQQLDKQPHQQPQ